jgi:hypothetical protein
MKNTLQRSLLATALVLSAGAVHAGQISPAELKVIGTLEVPACSVTAGDDGTYSYGTLNPSDIRPGTAVNTLKMISKPWKIECEGDTYLSFRVVDNAAASRSVVGSQYFGLGNVNGEGKVGYFTMMMRNPKVDGIVSNVFATQTSSLSRSNYTTVYQDGYVMGWAQPAANVQQIGKVFEADLEVQAYLAGTQTMNGPITDDAKLAGSLTLNFAYGL